MSYPRAQLTVLQSTSTRVTTTHYSLFCLLVLAAFSSQAAPVRRLPTRAVTHPAATLDAKSATLLQTLLSGTDTAPHLDNPRSPRRRPQTRTQAGKNANSAGFNSGLSSNNGGGASSGGGTLVSDNKGSNSQLPGGQIATRLAHGNTGSSAMNECLGTTMVVIASVCTCRVQVAPSSPISTEHWC